MGRNQPGTQAVPPGAWGVDLSCHFGQGFGAIDVDAGHVLQRHDDTCILSRHNFGDVWYVYVGL